MSDSKERECDDSFDADYIAECMSSEDAEEGAAAKVENPLAKDKVESEED